MLRKKTPTRNHLNYNIATGGRCATQAPPDQKITNTAKKMRHHNETQAKTTTTGTTRKTTQRRAQTKDGQTLGMKANGKKTHGEIGEPKKSETPGLKKQTNGTTMKDTNNNGPPSTR